MAYDTIMLIAQLSGLRVNVLANRLACESDLARSVHDKLASTLAAMIEDQRKIRKAESNAVMARGTLDQDDARLDLYDYQVAYHDRWLAETIDLLAAMSSMSSPTNTTTSTPEAGTIAIPTCRLRCRSRPSTWPSCPTSTRRCRSNDSGR